MIYSFSNFLRILLNEYLIDFSIYLWTTWNFFFCLIIKYTTLTDFQLAIFIQDKHFLVFIYHYFLPYFVKFKLEKLLLWKAFLIVSMFISANSKNVCVCACGTCVCGTGDSTQGLHTYTSRHVIIFLHCETGSCYVAVLQSRKLG